MVIAYTIKPVIWSGVALFGLREVSYFTLITGLGFSFGGATIMRRILRTIASALYRLSLRRATRVVFQNKENCEFAIQNNLAPPEKCFVVDGSGVDTSWFKPTVLPSGPPVFLLIARLLADKGLREYAIAAALVKSQYPEAVFQLLGPVDPSPNSIPMDEVNSWKKFDSIHYLGSAEDVRPFIAKCHVYVLPSYHEGMPRTVLEAMSMGRPILTTDTPGCRETVVPDLNGHIIPKANAEALANKLIWFLENRSRWQDMGDSSRQIAETRFDVHKINKELIKILNLDCVAYNGQA
jgi:glycosyltransferase involved in cell wall biosynthesis